MFKWHYGKFPVKDFQILIVCVLIIVLPFVYDNTLSDQTKSIKWYYFHGIIQLLIISQLPKLFINNLIYIKLGSIDIAVVIIFIYFIFHSYLKDGIVESRIILYDFVIFYLLIINNLRFDSNEKYLNWIISASTVALAIQIIIACLQFFNYFPSFHTLFPISGTFSNPGPYAGYLSSSFPFLIYNFRKTNNKILKNSFLILILTLVILLVKLKSRASIVAFIVTTGIYFYLEYKIEIRKIFVSLLSKYLAFLFLISSIATLYFLKRNSADGRLLIWKVCLNIIHDNFWSGIGYDNFKYFFNRYQTAYLLKDTNTKEILLAGFGEYSFNEFLNLFVSYGLPGLLLCLAIPLRIALKNRRYFELQSTTWHPFGGSFIAVIIFSCFSYPSAILPIVLVFVIDATALLSIIKEKNVFMIKITFPVKIIAIFFLLCAIVLTCLQMNKSYWKLRKWEQAKIRIMLEDYSPAYKLLCELEPSLISNGDYLKDRGIVEIHLGKNLEAIYTLELAKNYSEDMYIYGNLAQAYSNLGLCKKAEENYKKSTLCLPYLFQPKRNLLVHYLEINDLDGAKRISREILSTEIKIPSLYIDQVLDEAKKNSL